MESGGLAGRRATLESTLIFEFHGLGFRPNAGKSEGGGGGRPRQPGQNCGMSNEGEEQEGAGLRGYSWNPGASREPLVGLPEGTQVIYGFSLV